jgi:hypothetical protein
LPPKQRISLNLLRLAWGTHRWLSDISGKGPLFAFRTGLYGAFLIASSAKRLSTGRVTFDWDNHFAHGFDRLTPFLDVDVANSVPDTRFLHRPYTSLGTLAHFEGGSELGARGHPRKRTIHGRVRHAHPGQRERPALRA